MPRRDPPQRHVDELTRIVTELHFSTVLVGLPVEDPVEFVRRLGEEVRPRVHERVG
jgi:hypothetical protein